MSYVRMPGEHEIDKWIEILDRQIDCVRCWVHGTIFVPVLSLGTDLPPQDLDVFPTGPAVQLVHSVVTPTHRVSHPGLILHVDPEVNVVHR